MGRCKFKVGDFIYLHFQTAFKRPVLVMSFGYCYSKSDNIYVVLDDGVFRFAKAKDLSI